MSQPLRLSGVIKESIVDGPGIRLVVLHRDARTNAKDATIRIRTTQTAAMTAIPTISWKPLRKTPCSKV